MPVEIWMELASAGAVALPVFAIGYWLYSGPGVVRQVVGGALAIPALIVTALVALTAVGMALIPPASQYLAVIKGPEKEKEATPAAAPKT